jgi:hypothetical protein
MNDQTNRSRLYEKYSISHNIIEGRVFIKRKLTDFFPNGVNRGVRDFNLREDPHFVAHLEIACFFNDVESCLGHYV